MQRVWNLVNASLIAVGTVVIAAAQVPADTAMSNLASWLTTLGLASVPPWISAKSADTWAFYVGVGFIVAVLVPIFIRYLLRHYQRTFFEREYLELYELAYLSAGKRPRPGKPMPDDVLHRHRLLKDAINDGKLAAKNLNSDGNPNIMTKVRLEDFETYARGINHRGFSSLAVKWAARRGSASNELTLMHERRMQDKQDLERTRLKNTCREYKAYMYRCIEYVAKKLDDTDTHDCYPKARKAIRQAAHDGRIKIVGKRETADSVPTHLKFSDIHTEIDRQYWATSQLNSMSTSKDWIGSDHTTSESRNSWVNGERLYADLRVNMEEIEELWS